MCDHALPIPIIVSQGSFYTRTITYTAELLMSGRLQHSFVRLPDVGICGNRHVMILEKHSLQVAAFLANCAENNIR